MVSDDFRWVPLGRGSFGSVNPLQKCVFLAYGPPWSFGFGRFGRPVSSGSVGPGPSGLTGPPM